jgi:diketogulonate reductase-like aldo/keto reductase
LLDSVGALTELRAEGKIGEIGLSNVTVAQIEAARACTPIASVQNRLSLMDRADLSTARHCEQVGITYLAYQPLGGPGVRQADPVVAGVAERLGVSVQQVWLAWLLAQGECLLPLVGSTRPATILDSAAAVTTQLDTDDLRRLDQLA